MALVPGLTLVSVVSSVLTDEAPLATPCAMYQVFVDIAGPEVTLLPAYSRTLFAAVSPKAKFVLSPCRAWMLPLVVVRNTLLTENGWERAKPVHRKSLEPPLPNWIACVVLLGGAPVVLNKGALPIPTQLKCRPLPVWSYILLTNIVEELPDINAAAPPALSSIAPVVALETKVNVVDVVLPQTSTKFPPRVALL